jgi:hypothetical protein
VFRNHERDVAASLDLGCKESSGEQAVRMDDLRLTTISSVAAKEAPPD